MMLLAAITKASLTYTNAKVLPSPWGSGFDFLGCRPPPAHSDHSKEGPRRRSLGQRRVFSRPVSLWLRGYISRNVVSSSDNEPHYPACVNVYTRVTLKKKSGCKNLSTCVNMFGWSRRGQIARRAPRFVRANAAPRCASVQSVWSWRERSARSTEACTCRQSLLVFKSQDARRPFAIKTSLPVVKQSFCLVLHIQAEESDLLSSGNNHSILPQMSNIWIYPNILYLDIDLLWPFVKSQTVWWLI